MVPSNFEIIAIEHANRNSANLHSERFQCGTKSNSTNINRTLDRDWKYSIFEYSFFLFPSLFFCEVHWFVSFFFVANNFKSQFGTKHTEQLNLRGKLFSVHFCLLNFDYVIKWFRHFKCLDEKCNLFRLKTLDSAVKQQWAR